MSCGKEAYLTRVEARRVAKRLESVLGGRRNIYECPDCGLFHLTSWTKRRQRLVRKAG